MKITIALGAFFPVPPTMGGAVEKAWFALAHEFAARGHEITMISRALPELARQETVEGVHHIRVPGFDTPRSLLWLKVFDLIYSLRVCRVLPRADVLVTNTFWLPVLVRHPAQGKIYVHVGRYPKGQMRFYGRAARLQAPSTEIAGAISREVPALARRTIAIPYPRPPIASTQVPPLNARERIVLFVGRVHPEKGVHLLIDAFARAPGSELADWKLVIVGPTDIETGGGGEEYAQRLRTIAAGACVEFRGAVFNDVELAHEFERAQIFVYPSLAARGETFGLAPLEAMSHGCAVLVSDLACFGDFVVDNETGFVFNHNTARPEDSLAKALRSAVADPVRLTRVAASGRKKSEEFSLAGVAERFLVDFANLSGEAEPPPPRTTTVTTQVATTADERTGR
jgi:glycosyltransferase involved in cell wall biosynthesis